MGEFTACEVSRHCYKDDCWIRSGSKIYDVSSYLIKHPGGIKSIMKYAGGTKDAREVMEMMHSKNARQLLETMCIGRVKKGCDPIHSSPCIKPVASTTSPSNRLGFALKKNQLVDLS